MDARDAAPDGDASHGDVEMCTDDAGGMGGMGGRDSADGNVGDATTQPSCASCVTFLGVFIERIQRCFLAPRNTPAILDNRQRAHELVDSSSPVGLFHLSFSSLS